MALKKKKRKYAPLMRDDLVPLNSLIFKRGGKLGNGDEAGKGIKVTIAISPRRGKRKGLCKESKFSKCKGGKMKK